MLPIFAAAAMDQIWPRAASESSAPTSAASQLTPASTSPTLATSTTALDNSEDAFVLFETLVYDPTAIHTPSTLSPRAGPSQPDMAADFSEGRLETIVGTPQKELPGTKDAYVSYLVTTKVNPFLFWFRAIYTWGSLLNSSAVRLPVLPTLRVLGPSPLHRLRLSLETAF
jgi:hypothetical protein